MSGYANQMETTFTIGEVAEELNLSVDTLRFYEKSGVIGAVNRDRGGRRCFTERDKKWLGFVNCLKSTGMPLDKIRLYQKLMAEGDSTAIQRREIIVSHQKSLQQKMVEIQTALDRINHKVEFYDELIDSHGLE